jgi:cell division protease FtsH
MNLRALATSTMPLSEAFLDLARRGSGFSRLARSLPVPEEADDDELASEPESEVKHSTKRPHGCSPDVALVAVLLGRAFENSREALANLLNPDTVAIIQVPQPDLVQPVKRFMRLLLSSDATLVEGDDLVGTNRPTASTRSVIVFTEHVKSKRVPDENDEAIVAAMKLRCAVIGISTPFGKLPKALVRIAECRVVVPPIDGAAIADVLETTTGTRPALTDASMAARVTVNDVAIAVRDDIGAERSLARLQRLVEPPHTVDDGPRLSELSGLGEAKAFCMEVVDSMRAYMAGALPWSECQRGLLLSGPAGVGKTSIMRALCRELPGVSFFPTSYAAWQSHGTGHLGNVTSAIRKTFSEAAQKRPSIVYIDEVDAIPARGGSDHDAWWTAINDAILESIDGFEKAEGVFVAASCNNPSRLDPALVRAGRLDHHIAIGLPDVAGLMGIFRTHLRSDCAGADLREAALAARGHTGADVEKWVRVARQAARKTGKVLTVKDLVSIVRGGEPDFPDDLRLRIAYHEAGHAVAHFALGTATPRSLSIGGDGGFAESAVGRLQVPTRTYLEKHLITLLAGRAAEQLKFIEVTTGAGGTSEVSDMIRATNLALRMETSYGFGQTGLVALSERQLNDGYLLTTEPLRSATDAALKRAYAKALALLDRNIGFLDALAEALFSAGYLEQSEIAAVAASHPVATSENRPIPSRQGMGAPDDPISV